MHVLATAGHVDHGKSTLVRALTGADPDRLAEERRRGLTIELGYVWTRLPGVGEVAFVDVPGHERFVPTMLAGVGPVPAVLLVVAADDGWMPQTQEHLDALDALGVGHGLLVVTRSDLADPAPAAAQAIDAVRGTSLDGIPVVSVSARTGRGMDRLRMALVRCVRALPLPDPGADVRLWVDRAFTVAGAGPVVTGTLPAGTVRVGDRLASVHGEVRVQGIQTLGEERGLATGVARVAVRLAGRPRVVAGVGRGSVLTAPGRFVHTRTVDVRIAAARNLSPNPRLHVGSTSIGCRVRRLGGSDTARLTLDEAAPLRVGDRCLLRDPDGRALVGCLVLDPFPPPLRRRGAAAERAHALEGAGSRPDLAAEARRRGFARRDLLDRLGVPVAPADVAAAGVLVTGEWCLDRGVAAELAGRLLAVVRERRLTHPLATAPLVAEVAHALAVPDQLVPVLVREPLQLSHGRVVHDGQQPLPAGIRAAVASVLADLERRPFLAPTAERLDVLGLDAEQLAAAGRAGLLLRLGDRLVLAPDADVAAVDVLRDIAQPFSVSDAGRALASTRRVVLPLLSHLDRHGLTRRLPDDRREVTVVG